MTISGNYPSPVFVNGYACMNCADVSRAQKNIDPANPTMGPFDAQAKKVETNNKLEKLEKSVFDRDRIEAAIAAAKQTVVDRFAPHAADMSYGPSGDFVEKGALVNRLA